MKLAQHSCHEPNLQKPAQPCRTHWHVFTVCREGALWGEVEREDPFDIFPQLMLVELKIAKKGQKNRLGNFSSGYFTQQLQHNPVYGEGAVV